jgi:hypothetical protein
MQALVVRHASKEAVDPPPKVKAVLGLYKQTEPGCFRKDSGGKISLIEGYWYLYDRLGQQVAWVEGGATTVPLHGWRAHLSEETVIFPIEVENQATDKAEEASAPPAVTQSAANLRQKEDAGTAWHRHWVQLKEQMLPEHRQTVEEYEPIVKEKCQQAYNTCHEFWTHPDTQGNIKKGQATFMDCLAQCVAGIMALANSATEKGANGSQATGLPYKAFVGNDKGKASTTQGGDAKWLD